MEDDPVGLSSGDLAGASTAMAAFCFDNGRSAKHKRLLRRPVAGSNVRPAALEHLELTELCGGAKS
jgi:hypothetical protein